MGLLHDQLRDAYVRNVPALHLHIGSRGSAYRDRHVEVELRHVPDAHILARVVGRSVQEHIGAAYRRGDTEHSRRHLRKLLCYGQVDIVPAQKQVDHRLIVRKDFHFAHSDL